MVDRKTRVKIETISPPVYSVRYENGKPVTRQVSGGGSRVTFEGTAEQLKQRQEAERISKEKEAQAEQSAQLERQYRQEVLRVEQAYRKDIRNIHSINERQKRQERLDTDIANVQAQYQVKRVESGVSKAVTLKTTGGDVLVTRETAGQVQRALRGEPEYESVTQQAVKLPESKPEFKGSYIPSRNVYATSSVGVPEISRSTLVFRSPTPQEAVKIQQAKEKGSFKEFPPIKFLSGGYEFQKKIEARGKPVPTPEQVMVSEQEATYGQLFKAGAYPNIIRKGFYSLGTGVQRYVTKPIFTRLFGEKSKLSKEREQQIGRGTGLLFLGSAFSPFMKTGTYTESEYELDPIKGFVKKKGKLSTFQELDELKATIRTSSPEKVKTYIKTQLENLKKANLPIQEKERMAKEFLGFVSEARGGIVVRDIQGNVVGLNQLANKIAITPVNKPIVIDIDVSEIAQLKGTGSTVGSGGIFEGFKPEGKIKPFEDVKQVDFLGSPQKNNQKNITLLTFNGSQEEQTKTKEKLKEPQKQPQIELLSLISGLKQQTKQKQDLRQALKQIQIIKQVTTQKNKITPKISFGFGSNVKKLSMKKSEPNLFSVYGKRFGKDIKLFETTSKKTAEQKLFSFLKGTLGRSGRIVKDNRAVSFEELPSFQNREFRPSKKDKSRIVQRSEFSLSSPQEKREIRFFMRKKKKTSSFF